MSTGAVCLRSAARFGIRKFSAAPSGHTLYSEDHERRIAFLTLNNPKKRNALSEAMLLELRDRLRHVAARSDVRVVLLQAEGPVFSSGHDLKEIDSRRADVGFHRNLFSLCSEVMGHVRSLPQPVVGVVTGLATAAGAQLAATCDLLVASKNAAFATPGLKVGLFCTTPGVAVARSMNSNKKTLEMLLTGEPISAEEALRYGLVNYVADSADEAQQKALSIAAKIAQFPPDVTALGKKAFYAQVAEAKLENAYKRSEAVMVDNLALAPAQEGINAFVEKRHPNW
eukprot:TRINITY_DN30959_c0_g1_i1.p1 TRINITY_DN30959_c0_g1~~TRINITY_DN30959_c0_g1_i1.p1  ORF type:complete len:284 (-),score=48.27 TRINITY_DN30959_c0_g1_i1:226-1077(-)